MFLYYKTSQSLYFVNLIYYCPKEVFTLHDCVGRCCIQTLLVSFQEHTLRTAASEKYVFESPVLLLIQYTFVYWIPAMCLCMVEARYFVRFKG